MSFYVQVTKIGKDPIPWFYEVQQKVNTELPHRIMLSAEIVAEMMKSILEGSGYNLQKLSNSIYAEKTSTGIGIGRISNLPVGQESGASYWEAFNDGFKVTQANVGYFGDSFGAPISGGYGEKWHHTGKGSGMFLMQPNKVIEPLRYIDLGFDAIKRHIAEQIDGMAKNL